jgi:lambda repressor-like predicted transcriptional regulator
MKRKIIRLWAEYESDESPNQIIKPLSLSEARFVFRETLGCQERGHKEISYERIISNLKKHNTTMTFLSKERMDQLEEIIRKIDREYQKNQEMINEENEELISDIFG